MKRIILFICSIFIVSALYAQTKVVKGKLTMFNQYPVTNMEVSAKKAKSSATSDAQGNFELICNEKDVVLIKGKVFQSVSKRIDPDDEFIAVNLIYKDSPKNRALAIHMEYISEEQLSYAVKNLQHENTDFCNYPDVFSLIRNKFPQVEVRTTSSGEAVVYMGRGERSLTRPNHAIYVIDGVKVSEQIGISDINPCDIESITMIKSGTAMYGTGAANGVVVIETKKPR